MYYVYNLQSKKDPDRYYVGITIDLKRRLNEHNSGQSTYTNKFRPWKIVSYIAFVDRHKAKNFELYLKTSSGRAFAKKRL